jgi:hypothetical protein
VPACTRARNATLSCLTAPGKPFPANDFRPRITRLAGQPLDASPAEPKTDFGDELSRLLNYDFVQLADEEQAPRSGFEGLPLAEFRLVAV